MLYKSQCIARLDAISYNFLRWKTKSSMFVWNKWVRSVLGVGSSVKQEYLISLFLTGKVVTYCQSCVWG